MSKRKPKGRYCVEYKVSVFAYVDMDEDPPSVTKVVVDDESVGEPVHVEHDGGEPVTNEAEKAAVIEVVDGPDADWPAWEFGW
jgi:hypothetical protein